MGPGWPSSPADPLPHVLEHLGQLGLQVGQQSVQQLCYPPLLLGQTSLQHVQQTGPQGRGHASAAVTAAPARYVHVPAKLTSRP